MNTTTIETLIELGACPEALAWVETQKSQRAAWMACERGDWMIWLIVRTGTVAHRRKVAMCLCEIVDPVLDHVPEGETRPDAAYAAHAVAHAVAYAADATYAINAAHAVAHAVHAVADAVAHAVAFAAVAARRQSLADSARLARLYFPNPPRLTAPEGS